MGSGGGLDGVDDLGVDGDDPIGVGVGVCLRKRSGEYQYRVPLIGAGTPRAAGAVGPEGCRRRWAQGTFSVTKAPAGVRRSTDTPFKS